MTNRRRSERYRIELPVWLKDAQGGEQTRTSDVSAHGIAVLATKARHLRQYVELELQLPPPAPAIGVTAIVARVIDEVELSDGRRSRGFGLDFFLFDAKAKAEWQKFMARLRSEGAVAPNNAARPAVPSPVTVAAQGRPDLEDEPPDDDGEDEEEGAPTFIIKPRDLGRLWAFFRGEMSKGLVRIETPIAKKVGEPVELLVVHPGSKAEWTLEGRVARSIDYGRGGRPVLEIALVGLDTDMRSSFRNFVATGHGMIEEDVQISTDIPIPPELQAIASLPPRQPDFGSADLSANDVPTRDLSRELGDEPLDQPLRDSFDEPLDDALGGGSFGVPLDHRLEPLQDLEVAPSGEDRMESRRGNSIVIDVDALARAHLQDGGAGPLSSEEEALFEEYLDEAAIDAQGLSPVRPTEAIEDPSVAEASVSKVYALGDEAIIGAAPISESQDLPDFGAHEEETVGEGSPTKNERPGVVEEEPSTSPAHASYDSSESYGNESSTVLAPPPEARAPSMPGSLPSLASLVEPRTASMSRAPSKPAPRPASVAPVAPSLAMESDPETVDENDRDDDAPAPAPGSSESLSGRLFASFFFEAAQSKPPPASLTATSPPALRDVSLPRDVVPPQAIALSRPLKIEAKPTAIPPGPPPLPPAPPPIPRASPPPIPQAPIVRGHEIAVVRGAPVPADPAAIASGIAEPAGLPEVDRRTGPREQRPGSVKVEPWFEKIGNDALFRAPSAASETPIPLTQRRPPNPPARAPSGNPQKRAPVERRSSVKNNFEERAPQGHLQVSTEGTDPGLDRDIALARARCVRSPNSVTACYRLGSLLVKRGQLDGWSEAVSTLKRVMSIEPNHPGAHHAIAEALARRGEMDLAAEHLQRARRLGYRIDADLERRINEGRQR